MLSDFMFYEFHNFFSHNIYYFVYVLYIYCEVLIFLVIYLFNSYILSTIQYITLLYNILHSFKIFIIVRFLYNSYYQWPLTWGAVGQASPLF